MISLASELEMLLGSSRVALNVPPSADSNPAIHWKISCSAPPLPDVAKDLKPALRLVSRVALVRDIPEGASVSYGRTFITERPTRVATLAESVKNHWRNS